MTDEELMDWLAATAKQDLAAHLHREEVFRLFLSGLHPLAY